jgi:hypothetical protein
MKVVFILALALLIAGQIGPAEAVYNATLTCQFIEGYTSGILAAQNLSIPGLWSIGINAHSMGDENVSLSIDYTLPPGSSDATIRSVAHAEIYAAQEALKLYSKLVYCHLSISEPNSSQLIFDAFMDQPPGRMIS